MKRSIPLRGCLSIQTPSYDRTGWGETRRLLSTGFAALVIVLGLCMATTAQAFYVGASYLNTDAEFEQAVNSFDTDDSAYKFYAGGKIFKFLDLEASYRDLGSHTDTAGASKLAVELEAYDLAVRGWIPVGRRLVLFARAGYANVSVEGQLDLSGALSSIDDDDWELTYGAGLEYRLGNRFGLRGEWEEYDVDASLNSFSAGAYIRF